MSDDTETECSSCTAAERETPRVPHSRKACSECGRLVHRVAKPGVGLETDGGDIVIPAGWLTISFDQTMSTGKLFRPGATWLATNLLSAHLPKTPGDVAKAVEALQADAVKYLESSELLADLDLNDETDAEEVVRRIGDDRMKPEYWPLVQGAFVGALEDAVAEGNAAEAAWLAMHFVFARMMTIFVHTFEPLVWRGYQTAGYDQLKDVLRTWDENAANGDEEFWQQFLTTNSWLLSRIMSTPVVVVAGKAFVGGKGLDNTGGKLVDFLVGNVVTSGVSLIEIKTPMTKLLGGAYRAGVFPPSTELSGAIVQVGTYRETLQQSAGQLGIDDRTIAPRAVVLAGTAQTALETVEQKRSFEVFRRSLHGVEVVTFDEVRAAAQQLLSAVESLGSDRA